MPGATGNEEWHMNTFRRFLGAALAGAVLVALGPSRAAAHCDTLDGPVVKDARGALESGDPTPVLKWVGPDKEAEVRDAFRRALAVRKLGPEGQALADRFFFETLVRIHREGEGAPYTGLKPGGTPVEPGIAAADKALEAGSADALVKLVNEEAEHGIRTRFARAAEARKRASESVERGREYVAAYVEFVHYGERLLTDAGSPAGHEPHVH
jgi:hypothetical protein